MNQTNTERDPGAIKYVIHATKEPEEYVKRKQKIISAQDVEFVRLHKGNVADRLSLHTGEYDVPCGRKNPRTDCGNTTPFQLNLSDYKKMLRKNRLIFQFVYKNWQYRDSDQVPTSKKRAAPTYDEVEERPEGWLSAKEVGYIKDQDQSAVTRAIHKNKLTVVMKHSPKKRFIRPDEKLASWNPGRQDNFLMRRRLKILKDVIDDQPSVPKPLRITNISDLMKEVKRREVRRYNDTHVDDSSYQSFFEREISVDVPDSVLGWANRIDEILQAETR